MSLHPALWCDFLLCGGNPLSEAPATTWGAQGVHIHPLSLGPPETLHPEQPSSPLLLRWWRAGLLALPFPQLWLKRTSLSKKSFVGEKGKFVRNILFFKENVYSPQALQCPTGKATALTSFYFNRVGAYLLIRFKYHKL